MLFFSVRWFFSCDVCIFRSFSVSIHCYYRICFWSWSDAVCHSRGSPYFQQRADNSWNVPSFWGQYYLVQLLIQLCIHLMSLCRSEPFEFLSENNVWINKKSMECLIKKMKTVQPIFSRNWSYHFIFNKHYYFQILSLSHYDPESRIWLHSWKPQIILRTSLYLSIYLSLFFD